jgi:hypothetical protein
MPLFNELSEEEQQKVLSGISLKILSVIETQGKLTDALGELTLNQDQIFAIQIEFFRLSSLLNIYRNERNSFEMSQLSIEPPKPEDLEEMAENVRAIHKINVRNDTLTAFIQTAAIIITKTSETLK